MWNNFLKILNIIGMAPALGWEDLQMVSRISRRIDSVK